MPFRSLVGRYLVAPGPCWHPRCPDDRVDEFLPCPGQRFRASQRISKGSRPRRHNGYPAGPTGDRSPGLQMQQSVAIARAFPTPPLVVDLDGTLVRTDLLAQSFFGLLASRPVRALGALVALLRGKAAFKAALAGQVDLDCAALPFNPELLAFIHAEHAKGRAIYLASASDRRLVNAVATALGLFAGVFASDGATNLAGAAKAR